MSNTPALTLQDLLNDIERNAYDGISFTEDVNTAYALAAELGKTIDQLEAENSKLRELVTGLYKCWVNEGCEGCPMQDDDGWCVRDIRLRELGVEVD